MHAEKCHESARPPEYALILAALEPCDPERRNAWEHARQCAACHCVLEQGEAVLGLIDAQAPRRFIDPALKQRISSSVASLPPQPKPARWQPVGVALGAASVAVALLDGKRAGLFASQGLHCVFWEIVFALVPLALA